ncbi:MAG: glycosyltransferase family 4 protein [Rhodothalassiaceae bacterium]
MKILLVSSLYPNAAQPHHGVFVENRLRHLLAMSGFEARVIAPIPWFPFQHPVFGGYAEFARAPRQEMRHGLTILHPRFAVLPKIGMHLAPHSYYHAIRRSYRRLIAEGHRFDLIDAHYFYPDGVAAARLAREVGLPYAITGRGTDLNLIPHYERPRRLIREAAEGASALITVCAALADDLAAIGIDRERIEVLRNGVDLGNFHRDEIGAKALRARLGIERGPVLASVGHLIARKAHDLVIRALADLPDMHLLIAGKGPEEASLRALAASLGLEARVHFLGVLPHEALKTVYSAADILVLASSREGWPNVLLESMACGTPVVASAVNGTPEVIEEPVAGAILPARTPEAIVDEVRRLHARLPDPAAVRAYAERYSWDETSAAQMRLFRAMTGKRESVAS